MKKNEFYVKWLEAFTGEIPKNKVKKYVVSTGNYLWHVFSWKVLEGHQYSEGDEARKAFDKIDKRGAMYISWFDDDHTKDITWELNTAEAFDKFTEVYVVGKKFEWTYMKTHENGAFGPYFLRREVKK